MNFKKIVILLFWFLAINYIFTFSAGLIDGLISPWYKIDINVVKYIKIGMSIIALFVTGYLFYKSGLPGVKYDKNKITYEEIFQIWYVMIFYILNVAHNFVEDILKIKILTANTDVGQIGMFILILAFFITGMLFKKYKLAGSTFIRCESCKGIIYHSDKYCKHCGAQFE